MNLDLRTEAERRATGAQTLEALAGISLPAIRGTVTKALTHIGSFGMFEEYTKHDMGHIDAMLESYEWLIPPQTASAMTQAEWLMLTLASYLHDFGMLVTRDEFENRESTEFTSYVNSIARSESADGRDYWAKVQRIDLEQRERFLYQEFVRSNHARRVRSWLSAKPDPRLGYDERICEMLRSILAGADTVFLEDLGIICESHHLYDLDDSQKYPVDKPYGRTAGEAVNLQYVAILLRAADLLHITRDRTPAVSFKVVNPKNPTSLLEWAKQQPVRAVRPRKATKQESEGEPVEQGAIEVHAQFTEGKGYFGLTSYLQYAGTELRRCHAWARDSQTKFGTNYSFPWVKIDTTHVQAKGFVAREFEFTLDQHKVLDLLTGHTLYNDTSVVLRELVQNAIDAVRLRAVELEDQAGFEPRVTVTWDSETRVLQVVDNGTGMTETVINDNFLHVGSSRYQSEIFRKRYPNFSSISRFGIGVLSAFMIADDVRVVTSAPGEDEAREISLESVHGQYLMRLLDKGSVEVPPAIREHGTMVELHVRDSAEIKDPLGSLRKWIVVPSCHVEYVGAGKTVRVGFDDVEHALRATIDEYQAKFPSAFRETYEVRAVTKENTDIAYAVQWTPWFKQYSLALVPAKEEAWIDDDFGTERVPVELEVPPGTLVEGIRVTSITPGFGAQGIWALANVKGLGAPKTNVARTALEKGAELDQFVKTIYSSYVDHVQQEVLAMQQDRGMSLTRAAFEAPFVAEAFVKSGVSGSSSPDSWSLYYDAVRDLPLYVIEDGTGRRAASVNELVGLKEFATIDNEIVEGLDYLLSSVARSVTTREMFDFLGVPDIHLPEVPVVRLGRIGVESRTRFRAALEVTMIKATGETTVECRWSTIDLAAPRWINDYDRRSRNFFTKSRRRDFFNFPGSWWAPMVQIPFDGPAETQHVRIARQTYLLPSHPALTIATVDSSLDQWVKSWFAALIAGTVNHIGGLERAEARRRFVDECRRAGFFKLFVEESVVSAASETSLEYSIPAPPGEFMALPRLVTKVDIAIELERAAGRLEIDLSPVSRIQCRAPQQ